MESKDLQQQRDRQKKLLKPKNQLDTYPVARGQPPKKQNLRDKRFAKFRLPDRARFIAFYDEAKQSWNVELHIGGLCTGIDCDGLHAAIMKLGQDYHRSKPKE